MVVLIDWFLTGLLGGIFGEEVFGSSDVDGGSVVTIENPGMHYFEMESQGRFRLEYTVESLSDHYVNAFVLERDDVDDLIANPSNSPPRKDGGDALQIKEATRSLTLPPGDYALVVETSGAGIPAGEQQPSGEATARVEYTMQA